MREFLRKFYIQKVKDFKCCRTDLIIKILFRNKIRTDWSHGMLAIIPCRMFCVAVCYSKNIKIKICKTIILPVVLCGCETWSLTLREKLRLKVFENRVLRRTFQPKRNEVRGNGENYIMRSLMIYIQHSIFFGWPNREVWDGRGT